MKIVPWWPKWQLLIYKSYGDCSKYMGFLTIFATRAGVSFFAVFFYGYFCTDLLSACNLVAKIFRRS